MKKLKALALSMAITGAVSFSATAFAGYPVTDYSSLMQLVENAVKEAEREARRVAREKQDQLKEELMHAASLDAENNAAANVIVRTTQTEYDIANQQAIKDSLPAPTACETESINHVAEQAKGIARQTMSEVALAETRRELGPMPWQKDVPARTPEDDARDRLESIMAMEEKYATGPLANAPLRADLFMGGPEDGECWVPGTDGHNAMLRFIDNLTGGTDGTTLSEQDLRAYEAMKASGNLSESAINDIFNKMVSTAKRSAVESSLRAMLKDRTGAYNGEKIECELGLMKEFVEARWGSASGAMTVAEWNNPNTTPAQINKEIAQMLGFSNYLGLKQYEASMRLETLQALELAESLNQR